MIYRIEKLDLLKINLLHLFYLCIAFYAFMVEAKNESNVLQHLIYFSVFFAQFIVDHLYVHTLKLTAEC